MVLGLSRRSRRRFRLAGLLAAIAALVSHLALGAVVVPDETPQAQLAALTAASILCQPTGNPNDPGPAPVQHRAGDFALCPLSIALELPAALLSGPPSLPLPSTELAQRPEALPQARAPPSRAPAAAYPRGPPRLV